MVVDLRGNGGGLDCMAWGLSGALADSYHVAVAAWCCMLTWPAYLIEEYDVPATELMEPHDVRISATTVKTRSRSPVFDEWFLYGTLLSESVSWRDV